MPEFLVQSYIADPEQAIAGVSRARRLQSPRLLRAILVPDDQMVLVLWRADDPEAASRATRETGLPLDRISPAREVSMTDSPHRSQEAPNGL